MATKQFNVESIRYHEPTEDNVLEFVVRFSDGSNKETNEDGSLRVEEAEDSEGKSIKRHVKIPAGQPMGVGVRFQLTPEDGSDARKCTASRPYTNLTLAQKTLISKLVEDIAMPIARDRFDSASSPEDL